PFALAHTARDSQGSAPRDSPSHSDESNCHSMCRLGIQAEQEELNPLPDESTHQSGVSHKGLHEKTIHRARTNKAALDRPELPSLFEELVDHRERLRFPEGANTIDEAASWLDQAREEAEQAKLHSG